MELRNRARTSRYKRSIGGWGFRAPTRGCFDSSRRQKRVIYVCIPAHNEAPTVGVLLWKVRRVLGEFDRDYRLVVHDDASTDDTQEVLQRYKRSVPLTVLGSKERIGYSASVEKLLRHVVKEAPYPKRDCAVVLQGDFTEDPEDIVGLVRVLEGGADIVAGAMEQGDHSLPRRVRLVRLLSRALLRGVVARAPVSDPLSGLRAYRGIVLCETGRLSSGSWSRRGGLPTLSCSADSRRTRAASPSRRSDSATTYSSVSLASNL